MPYKISLDGTLVFDTLDELLAYQAATGIGARPKPPPDQPRAWTKALVESFLGSASTGSRELVEAVLLTGGGLGSVDFATQADMTANSLGHRFAKLQRDTRAFAPSLPMPAWLRGKPGSKTIALDSSFAAAAAEVKNL